jgi:hypothetical protein
MTQATSQVCQLSHPGFRLLGEPVFRLSEGTKVPSMVVQLDRQDAVLPIRSVAREFKIEPESADGLMLELIEQALDFVVCIRLGDKLPSELNGGEASWEPTEQDRKNASSRVRYNFVRCVFARVGKTIAVKGGGAPGWEEEPRNRAALQEAIADAATLLGDVNEAEVTTRLASINEEMAHIECMRRTLIRGISGPKDKLLRIDVTLVPAGRQDVVKQVQSLARKGLAEISTRFDTIDVRLDDILRMLQDMAPAVAWLRQQRNWLFRTNHAWGAVFTDWANAPSHLDDFLWKVIERTYLFLAPRFMSFQEWTVIDAKPKKEVIQAVVW